MKRRFRGPVGIKRECSRCGDDVGPKRYGKQRYCGKCHAETNKLSRQRKADRDHKKSYNIALRDVLVAVKKLSSLQIGVIKSLTK